MKIAFYSPHLCIRGTTVALYDFAFYNEKILNNESLIIYDKNDHRNDPSTLEKFSKTLNCVPIDSISNLDNTLSSYGCDAVYIIKCGYKNDGRMATACKTLIHVIGTAPASEAHGDVYAYGSYWLSETCSNGTLPAVPYMVDLPDLNEDLRDDFNIPSDAIVFGRNGGMDSWSLPFVSDAIRQLLSVRDDIYFFFQNTPHFYNHPHIIHAPSTADMEYKTKFINTCDAMIHARDVGESFGLSCGEFSIRNKPVITWHGSIERNHIYVLGDKGIYYNNREEVYDIFSTFKKDTTAQWNAYRDYSPEKVMPIFEDVFLK
tara:strand:- start:17096 stop:18046 length:951 start_codon:yes stop_codon:yes gene_type:complete